MKKPFVIFGLVLMLFTFAGCNIFSPASGSNEDPVALLEQGKAALQKGDNAKALEYFSKAMEQDPSNPEIRYYHAVATVRVNDIDFQDFITVFEGNGGGGALSKANRSYASLFSAQDDTLFFMSEADLKRIIAAFWVVEQDLEPVIEALKSGKISPDKFRYTEDVLLSHAIAAMVSGLVFLVDEDVSGPDFTLDPRLVLKKANGKYVLLIAGDPKPGYATIDQEIKARILQQWPMIKKGLASLYFYYNWTQFAKFPTSIPLPPDPLPNGINNSIAGQIYRVAYSGISALWEMAQSIS